MLEKETFSAEFNAQRNRLRAVAYRMLGSLSEADDALQEAWLRVSRAELGQIESFAGWLTTVVARVCLDLLRARRSRREEAESSELAASAAHPAPNAEDERVLADSVGLALLVVLESLSPAERLAFVLHDSFDLPFEQVAEIIGCSPAAARQLASRARRRVQGTTSLDRDAAADLEQQRGLVAAFLAASRAGDMTALLAVLAPDAEMRADARAVAASAATKDPNAPKFVPELNDAASLANAFLGRAQAARPALINGCAGAVWAPGGTPRVAFDFSFERGKITRLTVVAEPARLAEIEIEIGG